jgi:hypothetical protein
MSNTLSGQTSGLDMYLFSLQCVKNRKNGVHHEKLNKAETRDIEIMLKSQRKKM